MLALLPGCILLFPREAAYIESNYSAINSKVWEESVSSMNITLKQFVAGSSSSISKSRCDDMIARDYFSHVSPEGKDIKSFVEENGIMHKTTGENIQYCFPPSMSGPELFFNSWMDSEVHRANILNPGYSQIGIALSFNADKAIAALVFLG